MKRNRANIRAMPNGMEVFALQALQDAQAALTAAMKDLALAVHERPVACTFCGRTRDQVKVLVAGPTVYICDGCVGIAAEIVAEHAAKQPEAPTP
jgi:hypothetical protein